MTLPHFMIAGVVKKIGFSACRISKNHCSGYIDISNLIVIFFDYPLKLGFI